MRQDQANNAKFLFLKQALNDGLESGVSNRNLPEIMEEIEKRMKVDGRL